LAVSRFNAFSRLEQELENAQTKLSERERINQAKHVFMKTQGIDEQDAYAQLGHSAMNRNQ
jgi:response regulator NasT